MKRNQTGFAHFAIVLVLMVIVVMVGVGYYVLSKNRDSSQGSQSVSSNRNESGSSTDCPDPLLVPPVDTEKVTSILYPGQTRGGQYKPHGGFRMDGSSNTVEVKAPMDAKLVAGSRYIEQGEQQVLLDFQTSCGVNFRFDHLLTLSPEIQAVVDTLPPAKPDDSRTTNFDEQISVKTGDIIATSVGFAKTNNVAFDFGVYDTRQPNSASKDSKYKAAHPDLDNNEQLKYAVCWLDLFSPAIANTLKALPAGDQASGKSSDYCI